MTNNSQNRQVSAKTKIAINDFLDWMSLPEQVKNLFDNVIINIIVIVERLKAWGNNWNFTVTPLTAFGVEWGLGNNYRNSILMTSHNQDGSWFWLVEARVFDTKLFLPLMLHIRDLQDLYLWKVLGKTLLTSTSAFLLISIWLNPQKVWPHTHIKFKSWKSWLIWTICAIFSSLQAITKEIAAIENCTDCWETKL